MPELPELEHIRSRLEQDFTQRAILEVTLDKRYGPVVVRDLTGLGVPSQLTGRAFDDVIRRGKFLLLKVAGSQLHLVINPKLAGRLQRCPPTARPRGTSILKLKFDDPPEALHYTDPKQMGQIYLTEDLSLLAGFQEMGPDAMAIDRPSFHQRLRRFRGEIKGILSREQFVAGIGNAYADEILWQAGIHPYTKRPQLGPEQVDALFEAMRMTLLEAGHLAREAMGVQLHEKPRQFHRVHLRGGEACHRCGTTISEIRARQRVTNFCRRCQPGGLLRGMDPLN